METFRAWVLGCSLCLGERHGAEHAIIAGYRAKSASETGISMTEKGIFVVDIRVSIIEIAVIVSDIPVSAT